MEKVCKKNIDSIINIHMSVDALIFYWHVREKKSLLQGN